MPSRLLTSFRELPQKGHNLSELIANIDANRICYNELVLRLINIILKADGYNICYINSLYFHNTAKSIGSFHYPLHLNNVDLLGDCSFIAENKSKQIAFCFESRNPAELNQLKKIANAIYDFDQISFSIIVVLIVSDDKKMQELRAPEQAENWKRGFFVSFNEIRKYAFKIAPDEAQIICLPPENKVVDAEQLRHAPKEISLYRANILEQIAVGLGNSPTHYKLRFRLKALQNILPGQFIMLNTRALPSGHNSKKSISLKNANEIGKNQIAELGEKVISYLRRPFGIHRAFFPYFDRNYLKYLSLPLNLSSILHTVFPNEFDILYKVLENGVGTNELKNLKKGDTIEILGPLGRGYNPRYLPKSEIDEIHVVGGGVGMAPLVFMVQALKLFGFTVRAFIGIESFDMLSLQYSGENPKSYEERPEDYQIYVNDLKEIGLGEKDIFISFDKEGQVKPNITNSMSGFISKYYSSYLSNLNRSGKIYGFTCGPSPMMRAILEIAKNNNIQMHVLRERRMACGIGVCFSCVCKARKKNGEEYNSRVCIDGPIYDAEEIVL